MMAVAGERLVKHSLRAGRQSSLRSGASRKQSAGASDSVESEVMRLQRLAGNTAVSRLIERQAVGGGSGSQTAVRLNATFPSSLSVQGALESFGETTVGGSAVTGSLSTGGTVDVGASAVITGPVTAGAIIAPVVTLTGPRPNKQDADKTDAVGRAFDEGEAVPKAGTTRVPPAPTTGISEGEARQGTGITEGEARQGPGVSEGEAPQPAATEGDQTGDEESGSFAALSVLRSLTVAGSLAAGRANLGSASTIGGSITVSGGARFGTLRAGSAISINGPVNDGATIDAAVLQDGRGGSSSRSD